MPPRHHLRAGGEQRGRARGLCVWMGVWVCRWVVKGGGRLGRGAHSLQAPARS